MMTLADYITANLGREFKWGEWDCVLCAAGWVKASTGKDPLEGLPKWTTERGARRAIKAAGGLESALNARFKRINPNMAQDGDLTLHNGAVCLFSGPHIVGPGQEGLEFINRLEAKCAWSY